MNQREFDITIEADGSVQVHLQGFKGKGCLSALKVFQEIVGEVRSQRETSEFYEPDENVVYHLRQRQ